jgi:hypothetical protein
MSNRCTLFDRTDCKYTMSDGHLYEKAPVWYDCNDWIMIETKQAEYPKTEGTMMELFKVFILWCGIIVGMSLILNN